MEINEFNELVTDVVDKAISQIEQSSNAFEVDFTSSAGFDYDLPSFDISVNGITDFSFDGIGGSSICICSYRCHKIRWVG